MRTYTPYAATINKILEYTIEVPKRVLGHKILGWTVWHGTENTGILSFLLRERRVQVFFSILKAVLKKSMVP